MAGVALIAGGAGTVGSGIVHGFLKAGAKVVVPSRSVDALNNLSTECGGAQDLYLVNADVGTEDGAQVVAKYIEEKLGGQLNHLVTSLGSGYWNMPVIGDKPSSYLAKAITDLCITHYVVANAFLPKLENQAGSTFTMITGGLGGAYMPGAGFTTIGAAALWGLSIVVREEMKEKAVRVNEFRIEIPVERNTEFGRGIGQVLAGISAGANQASSQVISLGTGKSHSQRLLVSRGEASTKRQWVEPAAKMRQPSSPWMEVGYVQVVLVAGGAGTVGSGIVHGFLKAGAKVVVPSRSVDALNTLSIECGGTQDLYLVNDDVGTEDGAQVVAKYIEEKLGGQLNHLVTSLGSGYYNTPVIGDKPSSYLAKAIADLCISHYVVANAFLPKLENQAGSTYTIITGGLGGAYMPGAGFTTIGAAALWGLSIVAREEMKEKAVRVNEFRIMIVVERNTDFGRGIGQVLAGISAGANQASSQVINSRTRKSHSQGLLVSRGEASTKRQWVEPAAKMPQPSSPWVEVGFAQVALVAGGAGTVGSGIVHGFLRAGAKVVVPSRSVDALNNLTIECGGTQDLYLVNADVGTEDGAQVVAKYIEEKLGGQLNHLVTSLGSGYYNAPVIGDKPSSYLAKAIADLCISHYVVANAFLPKLENQAGSTYKIITGGLGGAYMPGAGFTTIGAAALWGLSIVAREEMREKAVRINEFRIMLAIERNTELGRGIGQVLAGISAGANQASSQPVSRSRHGRAAAERRQVALVAGGTGTVGSGIVRSFLAGGATVVVPSRNAQRLDTLRSECGETEELHLVKVDVSSEEGARYILKYIDGNLDGQLDHVVTSLGSGVWNTPVVGDKPLSFLAEALSECCGTHYVVATKFLPRLQDRAGSSFTFISGSLGGSFMDGAGFTTIGAAALWGLSIAVRGEMRDKAVRVNEFRIGTVVKRKTELSFGIGKVIAGIAAGDSDARDQVIQLNMEQEIGHLVRLWGSELIAHLDTVLGKPFLP
eukprot:SM000030S11351  [mRNA]  locus=s30:243515:259426:- [translate_table: standard]